MQEARGDRGRAAGLGGVAEDDVFGAEQLREVMRGQADAPLRQIEPSSCRIGRLSHGSMRGAGGHTPSISPPTMTRSVCISRDSSGP